MRDALWSFEHLWDFRSQWCLSSPSHLVSFGNLDLDSVRLSGRRSGRVEWGVFFLFDAL